MPTNWKQLKAIEQKNKERILELCPNARDSSGIYCFYRVGEDGLKYAYVGKSVTVLSRLAAHLSGYKQHIDKSIRAHGFYNELNNTYGYKISVLVYCNTAKLDEWERFYIKQWAYEGYQMRNVESGGTSGKTDINERKPARGYRDGVAQGRNNVIREIRHLFDLHLKPVYKADKPSKNAEKAMGKFMDMIGATNND